jgi:hypothetical protein
MPDSMKRWRLYNRLSRKMDVRGVLFGGLEFERIDDGETFVYPLVTACYPGAIKPGEKGILQPRVSPDMALSHVRNGIATLYFGQYGEFVNENLDLLYGLIFGMTRAEYEEQLESR